MDSHHTFSIEVSECELPESLVARFPERPSADERLILTIEPAQIDKEKYKALKEAIEEGYADIKAGRVCDAEDVFARLEKEFPPG